MSDISFTCPSCSGTLEVDERGIGTIVSCPLCNASITIPDTNESSESQDFPEQTKKYPYCAEMILADAKKCKHCGEFLNRSYVNTFALPTPPKEESWSDTTTFLLVILSVIMPLIGFIVGGIALTKPARRNAGALLIIAGTISACLGWVLFTM